MKPLKIYINKIKFINNERNCKSTNIIFIIIKN